MMNIMLLDRVFSSIGVAVFVASIVIGAALITDRFFKWLIRKLEKLEEEKTGA